MKTIEMTGKTVDEALKNALNELKLTKEEVDIEIIDEGSKGIFNLIGNKPARIKITKKKSAIDEVEKFLTDVLKSMDIKAEINIKEENDIINVNLKDKITDTNEIIVRSLTAPSASAVEVEGNTLKLKVEKELGVEIVGDIKVKINVLDDYDDYEVDNSNVTEDINIDEEYLNKKN